MSLIFCWAALQQPLRNTRAIRFCLTARQRNVLVYIVEPGVELSISVACFPGVDLSTLQDCFSHEQA